MNRPLIEHDVAPLVSLATRANDEHRACQTASRSALEHARAAGEALLEAKASEEIHHGEWLPWLEANFEGSRTTAANYMRIAERWPEIEANVQSSAHLSIDGALKLLADPAPDDGRSSREPEPAADGTEDEAEADEMEAVKEEPDADAEPENTSTSSVLIEKIREGLALEQAHGLNSTEAAQRIGVNHNTYRPGRLVVLLHDNPDLPPSDRETVDEAYRYLAEHESVHHPYNLVAEVAEKVYGPSARRNRPDRTRRRVLAEFDRAFGSLIQACTLAAGITVPILGDDRKADVLHEIDAAVQHLRTLRTHVEEAHK